MGTQRTRTPAVQPSAERRARVLPLVRPSRSALEQKIGYRFSKPALLELALTHRSHPYEARSNPADISAHETKNTPGSDNEQLEFIGDAVLGLVVAEAPLPAASLASPRRRAHPHARVARQQPQPRPVASALELGPPGDAPTSAAVKNHSGGQRKPALLANALRSRHRRHVSRRRRFTPTRSLHPALTFIRSRRGPPLFNCVLRAPRRNPLLRSHRRGLQDPPCRSALQAHRCRPAPRYILHRPVRPRPTRSVHHVIEVRIADISGNPPHILAESRRLHQETSPAGKPHALALRHPSTPISPPRR